MDAHGLAVVGSDPVEEKSHTKGIIFQFKIGWTHQDDPTPVNYTFRTSLFVPTEEVERWRGLLVPGRVLYIRSAKLITFERTNESDGSKFSNLQLNLYHRNIFPLEVALWHKKT